MTRDLDVTVLILTCILSFCQPISSSFSLYIGCYVDIPKYNYRDLHVKRLRSDSMTQTLCWTTCFADGYVYAGLQYGIECFCGNEFGRFVKNKLFTVVNYPCDSIQSPVSKRILRQIVIISPIFYR